MTTENLHILAEVVKETISDFKESVSGELSQILAEVKHKNEAVEELKGNCNDLVEKTDIVSNIQPPISLVRFQALEDKVNNLELMLKRLLDANTT